MKQMESYNKVILMGWVEWTAAGGFGMILKQSGAKAEARVSVEWANSAYTKDGDEFIPEGAAVLVEGTLEGKTVRDGPLVKATRVYSIEGGVYRNHERR